MNLIEKMIKKFNLNDYYFIEFAMHSGCGSLALVVYKDGAFQNTSINSKYNVIEERQIKFKKSLSEYVSIEEEKLSFSKAKKLAKPHFDEFYKDFKEFYCKDKEIMDDKNYTYYAIV